MKTARRAARAIGVSLVLGGGLLAAQQPLPPGARDVPPGHPPTEGAIPEGHPPAATSPHGRLNAPPPDRVVAAPDLGPGKVEVQIRSADGAPAAGIEAVLVQHRHDVAEGDAITEVRRTTDAGGAARFDGLPTSSSYTFAVSVTQGVARYRSEEFQLQDGQGRLVLQHVFPIVRDLREALVGLRGIVFVEPREDVIQVETNLQVFNIGNTTWVPDGVTFPLPSESKAFNARESEGEKRAEQADGRVRIVGTFPPGQRDIAYSFQVPSKGEASRSLSIHLPPHVAELRVISAIGRSATLRVAGFDDGEHVRAQDGSWMAVTQKQMIRGQAPLDRVDIRFEGLSAPSQGRWIAVLIAAGIVALGITAASRARGQRTSELSDAEVAAEMLYGELAALEKLRTEERIGPRAYARTRETLVDALARLAARRAVPLGQSDHAKS
jgi:hypothetical protein